MMKKYFKSHGLTFAILLAAALLHYRWITHVGGLWRDEANGPALASLPSFSDVWKNLQYDAFPILWFSILRVFVDLGLTSDLCWRVLGVGLGISCLVVLFWNARRLCGTVPLISLAMLGLHPTIIRWGDCTRAFGLGLLSFLILYPLILKLAREPGRKSFALAMVAALAAVHSSFYNSVLLFSLCLGGVAVSLGHRNWRAVVLVLSVGAIAAITLVPYVEATSGIRSWNMLIQKPGLDFQWLVKRFLAALGGDSMILAWAVIAFGGMGAALFTLFTPNSPRPAQKDAALFGLVTLVIGVPSYFLFLLWVGYFTNPWYYVLLMGLIALSLEACFFPLAFRSETQLIAPIIALCLLVISFLPAWEELGTRSTNIDLIASHLQSSATPSDLIVVSPCELGATFARYYHGPTPWTTIPPIPFHDYQRFDLVKEFMVNPKPEAALDPMFQQIAKTLSSGGKLWLIGKVSLMQRGQVPSQIPPAPNPRWGWQMIPYYQMWFEQAGYFLQKHALSYERVQMNCPQPVSNYENPEFTVIGGWEP